MKKKKATIHNKAIDLNGSVRDVLQKIRARLMYSANVTEAEYDFLMELQSDLYEHYTED